MPGNALNLKALHIFQKGKIKDHPFHRMKEGYLLS
jgi:hypothetical protein